MFEIKHLSSDVRKQTPGRCQTGCYQMNNHPQHCTDRRVQRTRQALFGAFMALVLERDYSRIKVEDVLNRAGVSRSTFYQHFANLDELLLSSMAPLLAILAVTAAHGSSDRLPWLLEHFWTNRRYAKGVLQGRAGRAVRGLLEGLTYEALQESHAGQPLAALRLKAKFLAYGQLGVLNDWLTHPLPARGELSQPGTPQLEPIGRALGGL